MGKTGPRGELLTDHRPTAAGSARSIARERIGSWMGVWFTVGFNIQPST